jgi:transcriptional regulator with XRE-family HTH domain/Zn-dependent peptidase ImmA (M78 family)
MITNERQLQISRAHVVRFRQALAELEEGKEASEVDPVIRQIEIDAVRGQIETLLAEIQDYEELRSGKTSAIELTSLAELPDGLIRARIAAGLTQKDLAERLGWHEQQIQRYEASKYEGATFSRVVDVADAIGVSIRKQLEILKPTSAEAVIKRLRIIGLRDDFIRRRISPDLKLDEAGAREIVARVGSIFGWSPDALLASGTIDPTRLGGATARFKMPRGRDARSVLVYTAYAYRLATICARAMAGRPRRKVPTDWRKCRAEMIERYGGVDFRAALSFAWDLGIVVLPLNDVGAFHGACWRIGGVNVIVLKQSLRYPARWLFDLLHELRHAGESPDADEFEVVEEPEISEERRKSKEEQEASWFAGQVSLDGRAEEIVMHCLALARNDLRGLKKALIAVAVAQGISASVLANYMAFRLSLQGENWWGVAANIQDKSFDPLAMARDVFFERFSFKELSQSDSDLLSLALHDEVLDE